MKSPSELQAVSVAFLDVIFLFPQIWPIVRAERYKFGHLLRWERINFDKIFFMVYSSPRSITISKFPDLTSGN